MTAFLLNEFLTGIGMVNGNDEWVLRLDARLTVSAWFEFDRMRTTWSRLDSVMKSLESLMLYFVLAVSREMPIERSSEFCKT